MDDASIRAVLRELGHVKFGTRTGERSVSWDALAARGIDAEEVARWVEVHGGRTEHSTYGNEALGVRWGKRERFDRLIVPEDALREEHPD